MLGFWRMRRGNGNSKCERSRNSKGRNSECLLLILAQVQPWLPQTPCQAQWPLSWAHAPELSAPPDPLSKALDSHSLLSLDFHDTSASLSPQPNSIPTSGHILSISFAGSCNPKFDLDLGSWVLDDFNGLLISLSPLSPTLLPSFLTLCSFKYIFPSRTTPLSSDPHS